VRSRVRTRTHGSVGRRRLRPPLTRLVEGAYQMTPALGERMIAERFLEHGVFIRELLPQDLKLELDQMSIAVSCKVTRKK